MARVDQPAQVFIGLRLRLEVVPGGDMQSGDAGVAPARGEIIRVHARAVGRIEERRETRGAERSRDSGLCQSLQQIGVALVTLDSG